MTSERQESKSLIILVGLHSSKFLVPLLIGGAKLIIMKD